jgi:hypothetical protein
MLLEIDPTQGQLINIAIYSQMTPIRTRTDRYFRGIDCGGGALLSSPASEHDSASIWTSLTTLIEAKSSNEGGSESCEGRWFEAFHSSRTKRRSSLFSKNPTHRNVWKIRKSLSLTE